MPHAALGGASSSSDSAYQPKGCQSTLRRAWGCSSCLARCSWLLRAVCVLASTGCDSAGEGEERWALGVGRSPSLPGFAPTDSLDSAAPRLLSYTSSRGVDISPSYKLEGQGANVEHGQACHAKHEIIAYKSLRRGRTHKQHCVNVKAMVCYVLVALETLSGGGEGASGGKGTNGSKGGRPGVPSGGEGGLGKLGA